MTSVVSLMGHSHSPLWGVTPPTTPGESGSTFVEGTQRAARALADLNISAAVVFGPDHFRFAFYDLMPRFCIGVQEVSGAGDYNSPGGQLPVAADLARFVHDSVCDAGFDPALSLRMSVDHGIAQSYGALFPDLSVPLVPIMVNTSAPPLCTVERAYEFGLAVGRALAAHPGDERVAVVGSGGLSHWPPRLEPEDPALGERGRDFLLGDRDQLAEREEGRQQRVAAMGDANGKVNAAWDEWVLDCLQSGELRPLLDLTEQQIDRDGGNGGQEIRTWMAAAGAYVGAGNELSEATFDRSYEPVPRWITGMGSLLAVAGATRETAGEDR
ncbi:2,3-dihydroxyphenylpropionate 1,2-dioxygenase [Nocardioides hungaricus]